MATKMKRPPGQVPVDISLADVRKKVARVEKSQNGPDRHYDAEGKIIRPTAGPADPATVKKMLAMRLAEREPVKPAPRPVVNSEEPLGFNPTRNLRIARQRRDDQIERNSRGEP